MYIRPIRAQDNLSIKQIIEEVMTGEHLVGDGFAIHDPEVQNMWSSYNQPNHQFYLAIRNNQPVGCGGIAPLAHGPEGVCELRKMYFFPQNRGHGLAQEIIRESLSFARQSGFHTCYLETLSRLTRARRLYEKFGFRYIDGPMGDTGHHVLDCFMTKKL